MSNYPLSDLVLRAFGGLSITLNGQSLDNQIPLKAKALLLYVCRQGLPQPREKLASLLWSDFAAERSAHNQRMALMPIREYLASYVDISRTEINVQAWVDANAFEGVLDKLRAVLNGGQPYTASEMTALAEALALYQGDFLNNVHFPDASAFDEWITIEREMLRQRFINAASHLIDAYAQSDRYMDAIDLSLRLLAVDPLHEETYRRLMMLYAVSGDRTSALQQFERCQNTLWDELGVEPETQTIQLYERIAAGTIESLGKNNAFIRAQPSIPNNLPGEMSLFVGRTDEIRQVAELVTSARCVTLTGPGGIGKTRLALQAARQTLGDFPDGVFWVELAPVLNAAHVLDALRQTLNLSDNGNEALRDVLAGYLRDKRLLLILDNFEHVLDAAEHVYHLLQTAPSLHILITSREALQMYGEHIHAVPVMPPGDAAALLVERAKAVNPAFQADDPDLVDELCGRLDYLPLAIELAASQARRQTLRTILAHLEVSSLASNLRGVSERQRTLFNTIEWSYELLPPDEQILYRRSAYFVGWWTAEAAFAVCGNYAAYLDELVDRSLLRRDVVGETVRYAMLETIRQHARNKLAFHAEEQSIGDRYIAYFVELAERANMGLRGWEFVHWLSVLNDNLPNFHAAIEQAVVLEEIESEARLIGALGLFWNGASLAREARFFAERALRHREFLSAAHLAGVLAALGHAIHISADYAVSSKYYQEARSLYQMCGDRWNEGLLILCEGSTVPDVQRNLDLFQQARSMIQNMDEVFLFAGLSIYMSIAYSCLDDPHNAERVAREGLTRANGSLGDVTRGLHHALGIAVREQGRLEEALTIFQDCGEIRERRGEYHVANMLFDECQTYLLLGHIAEAELCFQRGLALERYHVATEYIRRLNILGGIAAYSAGHLQESCRRYRIALKLADSALHELFGLNTFVIAVTALIWQTAAEGFLKEAAHLRDLLLKVSADRSIHLGYTQRFYLNRALPLLVDYPPTTPDSVHPDELFAYAQACVSHLESLAS